MLSRILPSPWELIQTSNYHFVVGWKVKDLGEEEIMLLRMTLINCPMGPGDEMIVPGNLEGACNMVSSIGAVEGKTCRSMCDI